MEQKELGRRGEALAARYLEQKGFRILALNYNTPYGELDIIAKDGRTIVFVEVKTRSSARYGTGSEAISRWKERHLITAATLYCKRFHLEEVPCRFDVISIFHAGRAYRIEHVENAFGG